MALYSFPLDSFTRVVDPAEGELEKLYSEILIIP